MEESPFIQDLVLKGVEPVLDQSRNALRGAVRGLWQSKFAHPAPADVEAAIQAQQDLGTLDRWLQGAAAAPSEAEARAAIGL